MHSPGLDLQQARAEKMEEHFRTWPVRFGRVFIVSSVAVIACCSILMAGCKKASGPGAGAANVEAPEMRELRAIGDRATVAVVARDVSTLLEYEHDPEDEASLKNKSGDLYCYLFDSSCIQGAKTRAVYDLFTNSHPLAIEASTARLGDKQYGLLMFYDKSQVSDTELYSPDFLCSDKALHGTASWHFVQANGKWTTTTLFDYKVEKACAH
jgi:hypothetical protein